MIIDLSDEDVQPNALPAIQSWIRHMSRERHDSHDLRHQGELHVTGWSEFAEKFPVDTPGVEEALANARKIPGLTVSVTDSRPEIEVQIDVGSASDPADLQRILHRDLGFPDMYGFNWNAFWDAITGLVEIPGRIRLCGWSDLSHNLPDEAAILHSELVRYQQERPGEVLVEYTG